MATNLRKAFEEVINHFNNAEYDKLLPYMDGDVIMKKVDDPGSVVGIGNVINYLKGRQLEFKPKLDLKGQPEPKFWECNATMAQVSGTGKMYDGTTSKSPKRDPVDVRFTFTFTRGDAEEDWLVINAFAAKKIGE